jgi:CelD/BcsL family acetyltransferase involved in cellulose biosynthesis
MPLPSTWEEFLAQRKRNVRESIRRSYNRTTKGVSSWSVDVASEAEETREFFDQTVRLNRIRSGVPDKPRHPSIFESESARIFTREAFCTMAAAGLGEASVLRFNEQIVAGLVVLRANGTIYLFVSGADPAVWEFGAGTLLIAEAARRGIKRGDVVINLSTGPNRAKLRWSEDLLTFQDFSLVGPTRRSRLKFATYWQASAALQLRKQRTWWNQLGPG